MSSEDFDADRFASPKRAPWGALAIMAALSIMSLIDRLILALLIKPLKADLHLSDVQLGLLFGTAFALFYGLMGLPLARIADRFNRVRLITVGVLLWSMCTISSGFATEFWQLLVLRAGLALGEAALFPTVHSLIFDMFDARRRPLAASIFTAAPPLGGALAYIAGGGLVGVIEGWVAVGGGWGFREWQLVFFAVGLPSLILGIVFGLVVREPARVARAVAGHADGIIAQLRGRLSMFVWILLAGGLCQIVPYAYQAWAPTLLTDKYGLTIGIAGLTMGTASALGSILGTVLMPLLVVKRYDQGKSGALTMIPMLCVVGATIIFGIAPLYSQAGLFLVSVAVGNFLLLGTNATILVSLQRLAPDNLRATMVAGSLLVSSSFGLGVGPIGVAYLANFLSVPPSYDMAMSLMAIIAGICGLGAFAVAGVKIRDSRPH